MWIAPSCSLLHSPYDLEVETQPKQISLSFINGWLSRYKIQELRVIKTALEQGRKAVQTELAASQAAADARKTRVKFTALVWQNV